MILLRLWNYIRGYVIILVEGYFLEKFINICIHRQIFLWDIKRLKNSTMTLKISIEGFKIIKPVARKTGCRVRIVHKRGLPFILHRYKGRKTFAFGALIFIFLIFALTSFVWTIEIKGTKKIDNQLLVDKLAEYGIEPGTFKYNIDAEKVVNNMMLDVKDLAWLSLEVKGTKVKVEIAERVKPPSIIPKDVPCNIVAAKDGIIKSIVVKAGQELVKVGSTVQKGQVLVSGTVPNKNPDEKPRLVHAIGTVKARTWYEKSSQVTTRVTDRERTGTKNDNYSLIMFSKRINIFPRSISYENYDKIEIKKKVSIGEDLVFPFEFVVDRYCEINLIEKEISMDEAKQIAVETAHKEVLDEVPADAEQVKTSVDFKQNEAGGIMAVVTLECLEDIGVEEDLQAAKTSAKSK